VVTIILGVWC